VREKGMKIKENRRIKNGEGRVDGKTKTIKSSNKIKKNSIIKKLRKRVEERK
jgi:hypothetical protein